MRGLEMLSEMARVGGNSSRAAEVAEVAHALRSNMLSKMWNATEGRFCDGICMDPKVDGAGSVYTVRRCWLLSCASSNHLSLVSN
jgi:hypothetical protein